MMNGIDTLVGLLVNIQPLEEGGTVRASDFAGQILAANLSDEHLANIVVDLDGRAVQLRRIGCNDKATELLNTIEHAARLLRQRHAEYADRQQSVRPRRTGSAPLECFGILD